MVFQLFNKFCFTCWSVNELFIILARLLPMGSPVCSTELKSFSIFLMRLSSSLSSPSLLLRPPFLWAMWGVSTSLSIWSSKSDQPHRKSSSSGGWRCSPMSLTCVLLFWNFGEIQFLVGFLVSVSHWPLSLFLSSSPLALALEICLARLMLIVAALVDFSLGLMLSLATSELLIACNAEK